MVSPRHEQQVTFHDAVSATGNGVAFVVDRMGVITVQVSGTFTTAQVLWEGSIDGTNYIGIEGANLTNGTKALSVTAAGIYRIPVIGLRLFRTRLVWTGGTSITVIGVFADFSTQDIGDVTLAANSGVDIGDVDVLSIAAGDNNIGNVDVLSIAAGNNNIGDVDAKLIDEAGTPYGVEQTGNRPHVIAAGEDAENAAITGKPVLVGGRYDTSDRTLGNGDVGAVALDVRGHAHVIAAGEDAENAPITGKPVLVGGRYDTSDRTLGNGDVGGLALDVHGHAIIRPNAGAVAQADGISNTANVETDESDASILRATLGLLYNGTTWDRMRGTAAEGQTVAARLIDEAGAAYGVKHIDNKPRVSAFPFTYDVAKENVADHAVIHILGNNDDTSTAREDMWEGHGGSGTNPEIPHPAAGGIQMEIVSSSNADSDSGGINPQGTGVRTVIIRYLDLNFVEQSEVITTDGTTPVNTAATDILRVQSMDVVTVGSGGVAAGDITLESTDSAIEYCRIRAGVNVSLKGEWTVPAGMILFVTGWQASAIASASNRRSEFLLRATSNKDGVLTVGVFHVKDILHLTASSQAFPFILPVRVPAQADIKVTVTSSASMETSSRIEGWYEPE